MKERILPSLTEISPIAHVALLQTDIRSGFRFWPKIGMKSAEKRNDICDEYKTKVKIKKKSGGFYLIRTNCRNGFMKAPDWIEKLMADTKFLK